MITLMDRTILETKKPKMASYWGVSRDDATDIGHSEYITRLTALRDSLIDQEQVYLAQALDRLRIHSLTNQNITYRLRMINEAMDGKVPLPAPRKNMQTTVEKFRQMRIKPHRPSIFPIQGTQLLEQTSAIKGVNKESGGTTSRSTKENLPTDRSQKPSQAKLEESIQANLQRLLQPRSSIPNIGRKAIKQHENLEVKPKPLANIRSRVYKHTGKQMMGPSQAAKFHLSSSGVLSPDHQQLYSDSLGLESGYVLLKDDTLDVDTIQGCNYDYYLVPPSSREAEDSDMLGLGERESLEPREECTKQTNISAAQNSKLSMGKTTTRDSNAPERYRGENHVVASSKNVISVFIPNNSYDDINGNTFCSSDDDGIAPTSGPVRNLAVGKQRGLTSNSLKVSRSSEDSSHHQPPSSENRSRKHYGRNDNGSIRVPEAQESRYSAQIKKRSTDAPALILSPATPDVGLVPQHRATYSQKTTLEKAKKQKEIRQKELQNLFEDVRELNMRTDQYTSRSSDTLA